MHNNFELFESMNYNDLQALKKNLKKYISVLKEVRKNSENNVDKLTLDAVIEIHEALIQVIAHKKAKQLLLYGFLISSGQWYSFNSIDPCWPTSVLDLINYASQIEDEQIENLKKIEKHVPSLLFLQLLVSTALVLWSGSVMITLIFLALFLMNLYYAVQLINSNAGLQTLKNAANPNHNRAFTSRELSTPLHDFTLFQLKNCFYNEENNNLLRLTLQQYKR